MSSVYKTFRFLNREGKRQHVSYKDTWKEEKMKSKEMIKVRVNFALELGMKTQRGSRGVSLLFT